MQDRVIIHADLNHCYAQIEEMKNPKLKKIPMVVGGNPQTRHGIVLAKNDLAKKYHIETAETIYQALRKCPQLKIIAPHYDDYIYYTEEVKKIYRKYSDRVESFGLDEAWIDLTNTRLLYKDSIALSKHIQQEIYSNLGLSVSIGYSFNKVFAKLGSDLDKHMGFTIIDKYNYKNIVYPLPLKNLLNVGPATAKKLQALGLFTIGNLAQYPFPLIKRNLGKNGEQLWLYANGYDNSEVKLNSDCKVIKSIGNSVTTNEDLFSLNDAYYVIHLLSETIAMRLKEKRLDCQTISLQMRDISFKTTAHQKTLKETTDIAQEIFKVAKLLCQELCPNKNGYFSLPYRSISLAVTKLKKHQERTELTLFTNQKRETVKKIDLALTKIRQKYGFKSIDYLSSLENKKLNKLNPKEDHLIYPQVKFDCE